MAKKISINFQNQYVTSRPASPPKKSQWRRIISTSSSSSTATKTTTTAAKYIKESASTGINDTDKNNFGLTIGIFEKRNGKRRSF
jgi:hypothetical protein